MTPLYRSRHPQAQALARELAHLAPSSLSLLLSGETGTGKSFLARKVHRRSRPGKPLVVVDCAALPESLLASELFGHTAGAFTDARSARRGRLAQAGEGTLLLERVDALSPASQAVLLRVLEEREFTPLGASKPLPFRARVIATAGPELPHLLAEGIFRRDLYHRLAGFYGRLLPLRERREDILPFARAFLRRRGRELAEEACGLLEGYSWPGNFRELEVVLERACLRTPQGALQLGSFGLDLGGAPPLPSQEKMLSLAEVTRWYAQWVLDRMGGNVSRAAEVLGLSRRTLLRWRKGW